METPPFPEQNPRHHAAKIKAMLQDIIAHAREDVGKIDDGTMVQEVLTSDPVTCRPDDAVQRALDLMAQHQLRRIPVVSDDRRLLGIIAQADIAIRMDAPRRTAALVEEISQPDTD